MQGVASRIEWDELLNHLSSIIDVYDYMNRVMSLGLDEGVREAFVKKLGEYCQKPRVMLDVGCGPGTLSRKLAKLGAYIIAVDPLQPMIKEAKARLRDVLADYVVAVGERLPLRDKSVDAAVAAFSLRDFVDWRRGLHEFSRVVKSCYAILDIARRRGFMLLLQLLWWGGIVPLAALILAKKHPGHYIALAKTIARWVTPDELAKEARKEAYRVVLERVAGGFAFQLFVLVHSHERRGYTQRG
ncbi:Methyltransferase type 11 [Pyrolobus fumarii 1A]|uniref:Methyltransferase type 11 n=1 Tax=Pyrolobus fumarii (strain DSM 11204 / 1A) TaxID=694429 RepID=G0EC89_PYRF1|nr:class I SAM-dependent methyltransferase [Pyrolobus fumarii]AEM39459.1 Methyltransferase type 11 [Pyrolobus fumarii 1A]